MLSHIYSLLAALQQTKTGEIPQQGVFERPNVGVDIWLDGEQEHL